MSAIELRNVAMAEEPAWKKALQETNAIGWIGFVILIVAIAVGSILWGPEHPSGKGAKPETTSQAAK
jgi:hypothetical protein